MKTTTKQKQKQIPIPTTDKTTDRTNAFTRLGLYKDEGIAIETRSKDIDDLLMDLVIDIEHLLELLVDVELYYRKNQKIQNKVKHLIPIKTIKDKFFTYINPIEHQENLFNLATLCDDFGNLHFTLTEQEEGDYYIETHINNFLRSPTRYNHYIQGLIILHLNECDRMKKQLDFLELVLSAPDKFIEDDKEDYIHSQWNPASCDYCDCCETNLDDTTFLGRIIKLFDKDIDTMDTITEEVELEVEVEVEPAPRPVPVPRPVPTPAPRQHRYYTRSLNTNKRPRNPVHITPTPKSAFKTI